MKTIVDKFVEWSEGEFSESQDAFVAGYNLAQKENAEKIEKLKKALEFYAKPSVWGIDTPCMETSIDPCDQEYLDAYGTRGGKLARQVLKEIEE